MLLVGENMDMDIEIVLQTIFADLQGLTNTILTKRSIHRYERSFGSFLKLFLLLSSNFS